MAKEAVTETLWMDGLGKQRNLIVLLVVSVLAAPVHAKSNVIDVGQVESHGTVIHSAARTDSAQAATTVVETIFPGLVQRIYRQVSYNSTTCQEITPGTWKVDKAPLHGTVSFGTVQIPLPGGACPGITFTWAAIFYTWTVQTALTDTLDATWTNAVPQSYSYTFNLNLAHVQVDLMSPPAQNQYAITATPLMPTIQATAKVASVSPDPTLSTTFTWTPQDSVQDGKKANHDYSSYFTQSSTTTGAAQYSLRVTPSTTLVGGTLTLKVSALVSSSAATGSNTTATITGSNTATIVGTNPQRSTIQSLIAATVPSLSLDGLQSTDVIDVNERMTCQESQQRQFNAAANGGIGPVYFAPDNGIGIAQLTDPTYFSDPNFLFNWKSNTQRGLSLYGSKIPAAKGYSSLLKSAPSYKTAIDQVNAYRTSHGLSPIASPPAPPFTQTGVIGSTPTNRLLEDSTRYYNGYGTMTLYGHSLHEFEPDLNYLKTVPNAQLAGLATDPKVWTRVPGTAAARGSSGDPNYVLNVTVQPPLCGN